MTEDYPTARPDEIGWITEAQMIEVDRVMVEDLRIELIQMMENAGRSLAQLIIDRLNPRAVTVLAGSGGNGGGGLVAARHLANRGIDVTVTLAVAHDALSPVAARQFDILRRMGVPERAEPRHADVVIDALIGYSLRGAPRGRSAELIERIGDVGDRVVALDNPSGVNVTDGSVLGAAVRADMTMTLALPKIGLRESAQVGQLYLADISVPPSVYEAMGVGPAPDFTTSTIIGVLEPKEGNNCEQQ
jgi:NAD(P)H-hydrate epimerase